MQVHMVAQEFSLTPSLREHLERRLHFSFAAVRDKISGIAVRLRDLNGPRGGRDMLCQVSVSLPGRPEVVIKEVQEDMYTAIDVAIKRAAYRSMRLITRRHQAARKRLPHATPAANDA